jgi:hypothetical protein
VPVRLEARGEGHIVLLDLGQSLEREGEGVCQDGVDLTKKDGYKDVLYSKDHQGRIIHGLRKQGTRRP